MCIIILRGGMRTKSTPDRDPGIVEYEFPRHAVEILNGTGNGIQKAFKILSPVGKDERSTATAQTGTEKTDLNLFPVQEDIYLAPVNLHRFPGRKTQRNGSFTA